jgi:nucleotide-binding universal stress UspA family protein
MTFRSILCPVDFSTHSRDALRYASALARRFGGRLTVLFVNDPLLLAAAHRIYGSRREFVDRSRTELARFVVRTLGTPLPELTPVVAAGAPAAEILRTAARRRSDVIVIGTEGLSGARRIFFGSTTEHVLRSAPVPVLAIPPAAARRGRAARPFDRVIVPVDLAAGWHSDVVRAAAIARLFDVPVHVVHVLRPLRAPAWLRGKDGDADRARLKTATADLDAVIRRLGHGIRASSVVASGDPPREIARVARHGSPLVAMSLREATGLTGRRGAIAYGVLTRASAPVLALPRRRRSG